MTLNIPTHIATYKKITYIIFSNMNTQRSSTKAKANPGKRFEKIRSEFKAHILAASKHGKTQKKKMSHNHDKLP